MVLASAARATSIETKSSFRQVLFQWSLGMFVSTPLIAILQGTHLLKEYRTEHGHAPRPAMPARGVAVAVTQGIRPVLNTEKPLRLLVVGDSLAAGVGMSKSGTPVLPESIARSLSKASGGRAVYWTCYGTPGVSASQIVQDIHQIEPNQPGRLERLFREWQIRRRKWQERQEVRRRLTELESTRDVEVQQPVRNFFKDLWEALRNETDQSPQQIKETTSRMVQEWWSELTTRLQNTKQRVKEDLTDIKEIVQSSTPDEDDGVNKDELIHKGNMFRRDSLDPEVVAQYDIAVVLTGLNDLKDAFMPHMTRGTGSSLKEGTERIVGGLGNQLQSVLNALGEKMDLQRDTDTAELDTQTPHSEHQIDRKLQNLSRPLVVVPELPIIPLAVFNLVPLCWFLIPLFRGMENNKKFLSTCFPDYVVFIPQPDLKWWSDVEAGLGPIPENIRHERLLLRTTDIAQTARERIQELMRQHYHPSGIDDEERKKRELPSVTSRHDRFADDDFESKNRCISPHNTDEKKETKKSGSPYVAMDKMHPNDEGYELWGRHIAEAIVQHWNR